MNNRTNNLLLMENYEELIPHSTIDIFILAASIDVRGYAVYQRLIEKGVNIKNTIVLDYKKFRPCASEQELSLVYLKLSSMDNVKYIPCEEEGDDGLYLNSLSIDSKSSVFIDITSICIPDLFKIFYVLKECKSLYNIDVVYAEPKYYDYLNGFYFEYEHDIGERDYRPLNEYFTSATSKEVILVCFLGFDKLVSKYIHERKEHSDVIAINGFPAYFPKLKDISLRHNYELVSTIGLDRVRYTQANNPFAAYNALLEIKEKNNNNLLDICVLGSKPMALGACMFALKNPNCVKISYPFPYKYRMHTSIEISDGWWYKIEF